jgi:hypothetical protein
LFSNANRAFLKPAGLIPRQEEEVMRSANWKIVSALSALVLGAMVAPAAYAGCGLYRPVPHAANWQPTLASPRVVLAALAIDDEPDRAREASIVGTWKEHWISEGSDGIKDGTEVDAGYAQWHSDGTEINLSGLRLAPFAWVNG